MHRFHKLVALAFLVPALGASAQAEAPSANVAGEHDELPVGSPTELAPLFHSALAVPDVADWSARDRQDLLDVVTVRYKNRLIDRAPSSSRQSTQRYVEQLVQSELAQEFPNVVRQTCAQYGLAEGACAGHSGYVRRALVLEEMLAQGNLTLDQMEMELVGEIRPKLSAWQAN